MKSPRRFACGCKRLNRPSGCKLWCSMGGSRLFPAAVGRRGASMLTPYCRPEGVHYAGFEKKVGRGGGLGHPRRPAPLASFAGGPREL